MSKHFIVSILFLCSCSSIPSSVKEASLAETKLHDRFSRNIDSVVSRVLKAYRFEAMDNIDFRARVATDSGRDVTEWVEDKRTIVHNTCNGFIRDYVRIKTDYTKAIELHGSISKYLHSGKEEK